jgi:hypothetical protein
MLTYARLSGHNDGSELAARLPRIQNIGRTRRQLQDFLTERIRVEHGISHLKNRRACHCTSADASASRRCCAVAGLISSQQRAPRPDRLRPPKALPAGTAG